METADNRTDGELLKDCAAGVRADDAFAALVARHQDMVYRTCLRVLNDSHHAEDATQAVFLILHRKTRRLLGRDELGGWLYLTAVFTARKLGKRLATLARKEKEAAMQADVRAQVTALWSEIRGELDEAVASLPAALREPVILHHLEGYTEEETSRRLRCSLDAVSKRISRGVERLRRHFARRGTYVPAVMWAPLMIEAQKGPAPEGLGAAIRNTCLEGRETAGAIHGLADSVQRTLFWFEAGKALLASAAAAMLVAAAAAGTDAGKNRPSVASSSSASAAQMPARDWPSWRGDGSGASHSGAEMVDSLDQAKLVWQSDPVGLSGCMYPGGSPGEGWCDPVISDGRVFVFWFRRNGPDLVDLHCLAASRGWASLIDPPDNPEAFARGGGHRSSLPSKEMSAIQRPVRADDIVTCLDDRTGKRLWERVFPVRGLNHVRVYSPLCVPCVRDGNLYALGSAGRVYALDAATGKTLWESDIGERAEQLDQIAEVAARSRHRAYGMVGLDAITGRRLWRVPNCLDKVGTPAVWRHGGKEYLLAAGERMVLVEPKTGKVLWAIGGPDDRITDGCAPAVSGDYVVVAKNVAKTVGVNPSSWWRGPSCYWLSLEKAERVWARPMVDGISLIAPSIHGMHAYVCAKGGVACVELETGKEVGQPIPGFSSAYAGYAVGDGLVFRLGKAAKGFPEMKVMEGALPGKPDFGEIHAPATANGRVYWRGKRSVWCYDFRRNPPSPSTASLPAARDRSGIKDDPAQLAAAIEKEGWPTRAAAAELLRLLGEKGRSAAPTLQKALLAAVASKDWGDTDLLLGALLAVDPAATQPAAPELAKLLESADELTRRLGLHTLVLMGEHGAGAVPALARHLDPAKPEFAALAARALGRIGPAAQAAVPSLVKCLESKDEALTCQAAKALCRIGPSDAAARAATIDAVLAHRWFVNLDRDDAPPRRTSFKTVALSFLGKQAVPQFLERAQAVIALGAKPVAKGTPAPKVDYASICFLADSACVMDSQCAAEFLPLLDKIPKTNPPKVSNALLNMTIQDLKGTLNQRDPLGRVAGREAADKKTAEESKKQQQEQKKALDEIPEL